uniref:FCP1 homology domain-containing protein n=1 Tax=Aureoumbra lagunensis TaxID=44058 RepID=A0A7S3NHG0_9STRA
MLLCQELQRIGKRMICVDFDLTLIRIHTGGNWQKTAENLSKCVRPCMIQLLQESVACGLHVAIVTFSSQTSLIHEVLSLIVPEQANKIIVRALDRSWAYNGDGSHDGKLPHMASAVEEVYQNHGDLLAKKDVLLIDDDPLNVQSALNAGITAVLCRPSEATASIEKGIKTLVQYST